MLKYITSDMMQETTKNKLEKEFLYQNECIVLKIYLPSTEVSKFSGSLSVEFLISSSIQKTCAFQGQFIWVVLTTEKFRTKILPKFM